MDNAQNNSNLISIFVGPQFSPCMWIVWTCRLLFHSSHLSPTGGSAEKNGQLQAGDELLNVNGSDVTVLSRIEAWGLMKRLPDGPIALTVRHRLNK